jgi:TolB-like protein
MVRSYSLEMMVVSRFRQGLALLLLLAMAFPANSLAQSQGTAALLPLTGKQVTQDEADILTDALINELQKTGSFQMMERSQMDQILKEQGFQQSGACDAGQCAIEMGRLLGIQRMLTGSIGRLGDTYVLSTRMVDVKTGAILKSTSRNVKGSISDCLSDLLPGVAKDLAKGEVKVAAKPVVVDEPKPLPPPPVVVPKPAVTESVVTKPVTDVTEAKPQPEAPKNEEKPQSKTKIWPWVAGGVAIAGGAAAAVILLAGKKSSITPATEMVPGTNPTQETVQMQAGWEVVK